MEQDDQIVGRGNVTLGQVKANAERKMNDVLGESIHKLAGGCLKDMPETDQTNFIPKKETIFYLDTEAMRAVGNEDGAKNTEAWESQILEDRKSANKAFETALTQVDQVTAVKAIQVLNYAKEMVYYKNFNNFNAHAHHDMLGINTQSEADLSSVKSQLASQLTDGSFQREIAAREHSHVVMVCEDKSVVR